ncbi:hypothetical protein [Blastococcus montanus]|uniref:hypothetical protein n=1 Tax=Blastococcus montanus TaxID=3144973 RepID=UPI0032092BBE
MSSVMDNRAAVFTSRPQAVEVFQAGTWWAGELLGWRHDGAGACQMWVRVVVGGVEEAAWTDLTTLRLPEPQSPAPAATRSARRRVTQEMAAAQAVSALRAGEVVVGAETTTGSSMIRDHGGSSARTRSGGRRRAPEDVDVQAASAASVPVPAPGRHRAPVVDAGRHRAADTGMLPAVVDAAPGAMPDQVSGSPQTVACSVPAARRAPADEVSSDVRRWAPPAGLDAHLLTRPMRLGDRIPHSRRPRLDGSLRGV